jgi:predicted ATPase/DNA-binding SARP family transcriptional activator
VVSDADAPARLRVEVLGPLRLVVDGNPVEVPGPKRRAVLALLANADGRAVSVDQIVDAVWPSDPPDASRATLQSHVSRLRRHLGPAAARLEGVGGGYRLVIEPDGLDAAVARSLLAQARGRVSSDPAAACRSLRDARALWRGPVLSDLAEVLPIAAWSVALEELRHEIDELFVAAAVAAGDGASVVGAATEAVAEAPLREAAVLALMRTLAALGRGADALRAAHDFRRRLGDETGLDPSPALAALEREIAGGRDAAPRAGAVPTAATPLVGRDAEVAAVGRLLADERLVTVVGPGGVGKTRVAFDVARRHDDVFLLALAPVTEPDAIPHALATALQLDAVRGDVLASCVALLAAGPHLLVVDNCEHVLDGARDAVATLLASCPDLTVLATSREPLGLTAEQQCRLAPLALPDPAGDPVRAPAVAVFVDRARRVRPDFAPSADELGLVADIVRRLEGMPLAIELAAGRLSSFGLSDLHARLDGALDLLGDGRTAADARHRTLRSTLAWSYDLLPDEAQRLFRHLAVFPDGVDLATAELVGAELGLAGDAGPALARLVDASMLDADLGAPPRYRMLETLRSFGLDRLDAAGERAAAADRLVRWAVDFATAVDASLNTADEVLTNERLRREIPNLRAAWRHARRDSHLDHAISIVSALDEATQLRDFPEVWRWFQELGDDPAVATHPRAAAALAAASDGAWMLGDPAGAARFAAAAMERVIDDDGRWRALLSTAVVELSSARFEDAATHVVEAMKDAPRPAHIAWVGSLAAAYAGDLARAHALNEMEGEIGPALRAEQEYVAGEIALIDGRGEEAEAHYERAIVLAREVGATFVIGVAAVGLSAAQVDNGRPEEALRGFRDVIDYWERASNWVQMWTTLRNLAGLLHRLGDPESALFLEAAADHAPEAAAVGEGMSGESTGTGVLAADVVARITAEAVTTDRAQSLAVARGAIDRRL